VAAPLASKILWAFLKMTSNHTAKITCALFLLLGLSPAQTANKEKSPSADTDSASAAAEDISGMYSFLKEGEFVQINLEQGGVSGYISREGDTDSDRGQFLDLFFDKASVRGHDITFITKAVHGVWFSFKGTFERGPGKTRAADAYYRLRGTLTEFHNDSTHKVTSHSREVEFIWLAQPNEM
jgi:hypothetical protein